MKPPVDYSFAKPVDSNGPWERVLDSDCPRDAYTIESLGPDDCFKLELSGWTSHVVFKPRDSL